jgi:hypothetical protein
MKLIVLIFTVSTVLAGCAAPRNQGVAGGTSHLYGFQVDTHLMTDGQKATVLPTIVDQLKIVETVGLPESILSFFHKIPVIVDPSLQGDTPGLYMSYGQFGIVKVKPIDFPKNKPILLHEFLHAYHFKVLGLQNQDIIRAYDHALNSDAYPAIYKSAHFLENQKEYFAISGTIYLFGNIQQPPFNCAVLSHDQPYYLAFLADVFGPHQCK